MHNVAAVNASEFWRSGAFWLGVLAILLVAYFVHLFWTTRHPTPTTATDAVSSKRLLAMGIAFLLIAGFGLYLLYPKSAQNTAEALSLSAVVLVGLALIVLLMAVLVIVFDVLGLSTKEHALALPEGSIRALIAFSLLLIFVCLAAFLYNSVTSTQPVRASGINEEQLTDLKAQFTVVYEPAFDSSGNRRYDDKRDDKGKIVLGSDGKPALDPTKPLYDVTYYVKHSNSADDFAKQIFTTLSTVFVSVVSFYFGSSVVSAGVSAGANIRGTGADGPPPTNGPLSKSSDSSGGKPSDTSGGRPSDTGGDKPGPPSESSSSSSSSGSSDSLSSSSGRSDTSNSPGTSTSDSSSSKVEA